MRAELESLGLYVLSELRTPLETLLDVASRENAIDQQNDSIAISLGELLQIAEPFEERHNEMG